jgi:hypothetical protein
VRSGRTENFQQKKPIQQLFCWLVQLSDRSRWQ